MRQTTQNSLLAICSKQRILLENLFIIKIIPCEEMTEASLVHVQCGGGFFY